jgi:hypothetical protein
MTPRNCPKCGALMEYVEAEPDVGISGHVYQCTDETCDEIVEANDDNED